MLEILNIIFLFLLLIVTTCIIFSKDLVVIGILMCVFSSLNTLIYLSMNAPDVAITEASVGGGLGTVFMFSALSSIKKYEIRQSHNYVILFFILFLIVILSYFTTYLPSFGFYENPIHLHTSPYYIKNTEKFIGIPNIVTAILASFRGYDTFGETIVIFTSSLCVRLILKKEKEND